MGLISEQINCYYYGYQTDPVAFDTEQRVLDLLASDLLKSELDEKVCIANLGERVKYQSIREAFDEHYFTNSFSISRTSINHRSKAIKSKFNKI